MGEEKPIAPSTMAPSSPSSLGYSQHRPSSPDDSKDDGSSNNSKTREVRQPFPCKVYEMLEDAEDKGFADIVSWNKEGNGFTVHSKDRFTKEIVPKYFNQTRYKSFQRQLSLYGFERATLGSIKGLRYHEKLRRGNKQLCRQMKPVGYKPRGQENRTKLRHLQLHGGGTDTTTDSHSVSPQMGKSASETSGIHQPMKSLPTVISSESIYKEKLEPSKPSLVSPANDGFVMPASVRACSHITERLVTTDSIALFEGMPFYLMTTLPPDTQHNANVPAALPPPTQIIAGDGVDGQMKKAWDIGFAVASTMKSSTF